MLLPCALSGVLLRLSFPVPGWFPLAWVALVPWLLVLRTSGWAATVWGSLVTGLTAAGLGLSWQFLVTLPGGAGLTVYVASYYVLFACLLRVACGRLRLPMPVAAPVLWVGCEYLRGWFLTGFPWLFLGHTQQPFLLLVQVCDLFGACALSFLVMMGNALAAEAAVLWHWRHGLPPYALQGWFHGCFLIARGPKERPLLRLVGSAGLFAVLLAASLAYGAWRLARLDSPEGLRVGLVQANIPQEVKNVLTLESRCNTFWKHWKTTLDLKALAGSEPLDLIVWPESMVMWPLNWPELPEEEDFVRIFADTAAANHANPPPGTEPSFRGMLWALAREMRCPLLVGAHTVVGRDLEAPHEGVVERLTEREIVFDGQACPIPDFVDPLTGLRPPRRDLVRDGQKVAEGQRLVEYSLVFNSAYLFRPEGETGPVERYDKIHLVPFGEYVPLKKWLWFLLPVVPYARGFDAADRATLFRVGPHTFGALICFEDAFPGVVRQFLVRGDGPGADFLINTTNDGWFKDSHELEQHLAISALRAVEFRTGIVRCTNTGISGLIDPDGRIHSYVRDASGRVKEVGGVSVGRVRLRTGTTFYARHGDLLAAACFAFACFALLAGLLPPLLARLRRKASPSRLSSPGPRSPQPGT